MNNVATDRIVRLSYESSSKIRINRWLDELNDPATQADMHALQRIKIAIEADLALAELKIKVRSADKAKWLLWFSLLLPVIASLVGAYIGARVR